ncbi:MAG TPA: hypothetical protein VE090_02035 [Methylomirabilota bacterium]|nr:hypothetical protein [Methylomirabilota bacterium]
MKDIAILITGDKKDFPSCVFDTVGVVNYEETTNKGEDKIQSFYFVRFNKDKFDKCYKKLQALGEVTMTKSAEINH